MLRASVLSIAIVLAVGCGSGGGGGGGTPPAVTAVVLTYPSGRVMARGFYIAGTTIRTAHWTRYFDADAEPRQWDGDYRDDGIDAAKPWTEWNLDGSVRNDSSDR